MRTGLLSKARAAALALSCAAIVLLAGEAAAAHVPGAKPEPPAFADRMDAAVTAVATAGPGGGAQAAREQGLTARAGLITIEVWTRRDRAALDAVLAAGGEVGSAAPGILEARVPSRALAELGRAQAIRRLAAPTISVPEAITGEGVADTGTDAAHASGVTGAGVKVAIIDRGFADYTTRQSQGDLPAALTTQNYCAAPGGLSGNPPTSHGTSVAEIVHDMAPDAELFLICIDNSADLAAAGQYIAEQGVQVANHSVTHFNTSRGDGSGIAGTPDATVEAARNAGIFWANSAGNRAQLHWGGNYNPGGGSSEIHDWVAGDQRNLVQFDAGDAQCLFLKWDAWPVTAFDFDLFLFPAGGGFPVAASTDVQDGDDPPIESLCYTSGATANYGVEVTRFDAGTATPRLDLFHGDADAFEHRVAAGSVTEPGSAPEAIAAGAYCWASDGLQPFSSQGPTIDGRLKPDLSGPDAVSGAAAGLFATCGGGSGFGGTSAASPHVAGAAALVRQGSPASVTQVEEALEAMTLDHGPPGPDNLYGAGALRLLPGLPDVRLSRTKLKLKPGKKRKTTLTLTNTGPLLGSMELDGPRKQRKVSFKYRHEGVNVTGEVARGEFAPALGVAASTAIEITVRAKRKAKGRQLADVAATNRGDPATFDFATMRVKVKRKR